MANSNWNTDLIGKKLKEWFEYFHRNPELSNKEFGTTEKIRSELTSMGIEIIDSGLKTGLIAKIQGNCTGPAIAIRADIDALPVSEDPSHTLRSENDGIMHACGHDSHITSLLGAAMLLSKAKDKLKGTVLLVFQPAEEVSTGAYDVLETGILQKYNVCASFANHVMPDVPLGQVGLITGPCMAGQDFFNINIHGKGAHGAAPQYAHDPIIAGTAIINALQTITSRIIDPVHQVVLSVCSVHSGTKHNIIPDDMEIKGTCRCFSAEDKQTLRDSIIRLASETAKANNCTAEVSFEKFASAKAVVNSSELVQIAQESAMAVYGEENIYPVAARMTSEDFARYGEIAPAYIYQAGIRTDTMQVGLHNCAIVVDQSAIGKISALFAETAVRALNFFSEKSDI